MSEFELDLHNTVAQLFNTHDALPNTTPTNVVVQNIDKNLCTVRIITKQGEYYLLTLNHNTKTILRLDVVTELFELDNTLQLELCRILGGLI